MSLWPSQAFEPFHVEILNATAPEEVSLHAISQQLTSMFGSAFITPDNLEYLIAEAGAGATYMMSDRLQLSGTLTFAGRYRKQLTLSEGAFISARYMFD